MRLPAVILHLCLYRTNQPVKQSPVLCHLQTHVYGGKLHQAIFMMCYAERKCFRAAQGSQGIQCCRAYYKAHQRETEESLELECNSSIIEQLLMTSCSVVFPCNHSCVLQYLYCMHSASCSVMPARPNFGIACNFYFLLTEVGYRRVA